MASLHLLTKPATHPAFKQCLQAMAVGDALLLLEDGVYALTVLLSETSAHNRNSLYAIQLDATARGVSILCSDKVSLIDYAGMVELTTRYARTVSWY